METHKVIQKKAQTLARLERQLALEKIKKRKAETRRKIEFGGLVVKAKLDQYSKAVILGALIQARQALQDDEGTQTLYQSIGEAAFMEFAE